MGDGAHNCKRFLLAIIITGVRGLPQIRGARLVSYGFSIPSRGLGYSTFACLYTALPVVGLDKASASSIHRPVAKPLQCDVQFWRSNCLLHNVPSFKDGSTMVSLSNWFEEQHGRFNSLAKEYFAAVQAPYNRETGAFCAETSTSKDHVGREGSQVKESRSSRR